MKMKYTLTALAALTVGANAATILTQSSNTGWGSYGGQTFAVNDSGFGATGDALTGSFDLNSVEFTRRTGSGSTTGQLFLEVYDGATFLTASDNSINWDGLAGDATGTFNFTTAATQGLTDATTYTFRFSDTAADDSSFAQARIYGGNVPASPLSSGTLLNIGGGAQDTAYDAQMTINITAVPEPSSTALLGLGGLALILRRRK